MMLIGVMLIVMLLLMLLIMNATFYWLFINETSVC
jgi:hypothetical protein